MTRSGSRDNATKETLLDRRHYRIRVAGYGGPLWSEWFAGLTVTNLENGEAILSGPLADPATLHGVLMLLRDLGLPPDGPAGTWRQRYVVYPLR